MAAFFSTAHLSLFHKWRLAILVVTPILACTMFSPETRHVLAAADETIQEAAALLPIENRPDNFNGAVGHFRAVTLSAQPRELEAEDPLKLSIRITASSPVVHPPARPNLRQLEEFKDLFYVEDLPDADQASANNTSWKFTYQLRPRNPSVKAIPSFAFCYFNPDFLKPTVPARSRGYQTIYSNEIPLVVRPRTPVQMSPTVAESLRPPETVRQLVPVRLGQIRRFPGPAWLILGLVAPPLVAALWYFCWSRMYPDMARLLRRRRNAAARQALAALTSPVLRQVHASPAAQADRIAEVIVTYLDQRFGLAIAELTPLEAAQQLREQVSPELAEQAAQLLRSIDAARFAPDHADSNSQLVSDAQRFVLAIETSKREKPLC